MSRQPRRWLWPAVAVLVLAAGGIFWQRSRSTPERLASRISGLEITNARVVEFDHQASSTHPDETVAATLELQPDEFTSLVRSAEGHNYRWLAPGDSNALTVTDAAGADSVLYRLRGSVEEASFDLVVLVPTRRQVVIRSVTR